MERRRLFEALTGLILHQAKARPLLLIVVDLHWSDEATLQFLLYLVRRTKVSIVSVGISDSFMTGAE